MCYESLIKWSGAHCLIIIQKEYLSVRPQNLVVIHCLWGLRLNMCKYFVIYFLWRTSHLWFFHNMPKETLKFSLYSVSSLFLIVRFENFRTQLCQLLFAIMLQIVRKENQWSMGMVITKKYMLLHCSKMLVCCSVSIFTNILDFCIKSNLTGHFLFDH